MTASSKLIIKGIDAMNRTFRLSKYYYKKKLLKITMLKN